MFHRRGQTLTQKICLENALKFPHPKTSQSEQHPKQHLRLHMGSWGVTFLLTYLDSLHVPQRGPGAGDNSHHCHHILTSFCKLFTKAGRLIRRFILIRLFSYHHDWQ